MSEGVKVIEFGEDGEWAVSTDDGCLLFHPQYKINPDKTAEWIWKEAWDFVESQGGFEAVRDKLRKMTDSSYTP